MGDRICTVDECPRKHYARGWCFNHYNSWRRHGDPLFKPPPLVTEDPDRFWRQVNKDGPLPLWAPFLGTCWIWTGGINGKGYGYTHAKNRQELAHRYSYKLLVGEPPKRPLCFDHICRVRECVRPDHLEIVTLGENVLRGVGRTAAQKRQTHCKRGHPLSGDNLRLTHQGYRRCRACTNLKGREANARRKRKK